MILGCIFSCESDKGTSHHLQLQVYSWALRANSSLVNVTLEALSQEVVVGLLALSLAVN